MTGEEKTFLVVGGLAAAAIVVFYLYQQNVEAEANALNQPGLITQPVSTPSSTLSTLLSAGGLGGLISSIGSGISTQLAGATGGNVGGGFSSQTDGSNDPTLENDEDPESYDGSDDNDDLVADSEYDPDEGGVENIQGDD
jgi:hypothetical protein